VAAFKLEERAGKWQLTPAWLSRDMDLAEEVVIANGVVFAYAAGEDATQVTPDKAWDEPGGPVYGGGLSSGPARRIPTSRKAALYALDGQTGKELWSSGTQITSWNHFSGLTIANGRAERGGGISNAGTLKVASCVLSNNQATGGSGGGIYSSADLTISNSTFVGNLVTGAAGSSGPVNVCTECFALNLAGAAGQGGGLFTCCGTATIINSTFFRNNALGGPGGTCRKFFDIFPCVMGYGGDGEGGGLFVGSGDANLLNCTVSGNDAQKGPFGEPQAYSRGGGICNKGGTVNLRNTLIAGNTTGPFYFPGGSSVGPDAEGIFSSQGFNLIAITNDSSGWNNTDLKSNYSAPLDPKLGPFSDNGGTTYTLALFAGSPALDAGDDALLGPPYNFTSDQRGLPRRSGTHVDIGALEYQLPSMPLYIAVPINVNQGAFQLSFSNSPGGTFTVLSATNPFTPLNNWNVLGIPTETLPGQFRFTDLQSTNAERFYRLRSP